MKVKTLNHVNGRTLDGRVFAAGEGSVTEVDGGDVGMVALFRSWAASGAVEILEEEAPTVDLEELRAEAESVGVKVDKRWGTDRLREEIAAAANAGEAE